MSIRRALDALLEALQDAGIPLVASMARGLLRAEIDARVASLPGQLPAEVVEYFEWRNGLTPDREADVELFPQGIPLSLDEAVAQYDAQRHFAAQIANQSGLPADDFWHERWLPLFHNGAGDYHLTLLGRRRTATSPVHTVTNEDREPLPAFDSLTALVETVAARWRAGAYSLSEDGVLEEDKSGQDAGPVAAQVALLRDPDEWTRCDGARRLGDLRDPRAIPELVRALEDPSDLVAKTAAGSLGQLKARNAVPALIAALERGRPQTRATAAWALGELKAETARDALIRALDDPLGMVKQNAAAALTRLDQKRR
jgi:hypothetical protein